jgi:hypothetical protein
MKAWVIVYTTGEYSDRTETIVSVYASEASASAWANERNAWLQSHGLHTDNPSASYEFRETIKEQTGLDVDYTGGDYAVHGPFEVQP